RLEEADRPVPEEGELLVRVHAAAITRGELEWPTNRLPAVPSYELSGVVAETGEEVFALTPSDRDGVAADYALVPADVLAVVPAVDSTYSLERAREAFERVAERGKRGKVVLDVAGT